MLLLQTATWSNAAPDVFLEVNRRLGNEKISLMVVPFEGAKQHEAHIKLAQSVFHADLIHSEVFHVVEGGEQVPFVVSDGLPDAQTILKAHHAGISVLAWAKLYFQKNEWIMESVAYETSEGQQVIGLKISGDEKSIRAMAHRFSDKLVWHFTGETGIAETKIAYISDVTGQKEIYLIDYDGANETRLTGDRSIILFPRWSYDAKLIGYTSYRGGTPEVYFLNLESGQRQRRISFSGLNFSPSWSPMGDLIAFATTKDGNAEIYTMRPDGEEIKRLTFNGADDLSPIWSKTGREIAFTSDRGGNPQIYIMDMEGANVQRLTFSGNYNTSPSWSPKGDLIAYACQNEARWQKICLIRLDGSQVVQITEDGPWDDESPSWAVNGRILAFTSNRTGKHQIYTIRADGTGLTRLTSNGANNRSPSWSPR